MTEKTSPTNAPEGAHPAHASPAGTLLREPLLHFLLLGAALFGVYACVSKDAETNKQRIVVSANKIEHLAALFHRTWQRPPTRQEIEGLVDDYVREEAAYREGLAIGLDRGDTIIRRRVRQKLEFVAEDLAAQIEPTDEDLKGYLREHRDDYKVAPRLTFRQVFFDPDKRGENTEAAVAALVDKLREDPAADPLEQGDRTLLEHRYESVSQNELSDLLGERFASHLVQIEPGRWHGPVPSAYGVHAVIVDELQPSRERELDEVHDVVLREWEHGLRTQLTAEYYQRLLGGYDIVIDWPETTAARP